jgi:hypothetical protein
MEKQTMTQQHSDLLWGANGISKYIGCSDRQLRYIIDTKRLPVCKIDGKLAASRKAIDLWVAERIADGLPPGRPAPAQRAEA